MTAFMNSRERKKNVLRNMPPQTGFTGGIAGSYHPARDIMALQFKGMSRALEKMARELSCEYRPLKARSRRYELRTGMASYGKEGRISGDSCLCAPVSEGEFLIALSDGMGQGLKAAEESTVTVNTLFQPGKQASRWSWLFVWSIPYFCKSPMMRFSRPWIWALSIFILEESGYSR